MGDVFILGAGASMPYGFPNGDSLLCYLKKKTYDEDYLLEIFSYAAGTDSHYAFTVSGHSNKKILADRWLNLLNESTILTIDQILKNNAADQDLYFFGKMAIAQSILEFEYKTEQDTNPKNSSMKSIDWIQYFLTEVDRPKDWQSVLQKTQFITYNYDRVLEFLLHRYLTVDKYMTIEEAHQFIADMAIHHINGYIGPLSEFPFGTIILEKMQTIAESIRTVWDQQVEDKTAEMIKEKLDQAERVFILGTSFIKENFEVISFTKDQHISEKKNIFATGYGLSEYQRKRAVEMFGGQINPGTQVSMPKFWTVQDITALDLIKDYYCS